MGAGLWQTLIMRSIMPPGYSQEAKRRRLEEELRQARAAELAAADKKQRARIEKEIRAEVNRRSRQERWRSFSSWVHW